MIRLKLEGRTNAVLDVDEPVVIDISGEGWEVDGLDIRVTRAGDTAAALAVDTGLLRHEEVEQAWEVGA